MKDINLKEKFIQLRAKGVSFDKISKETSSSKPTLLKWSEEFEGETVNLAYLEMAITMVIITAKITAKQDSVQIF